MASQYSEGITVNPKSEITGPKWIKIIQSSNDIPDYYKKIYWRRNRITVKKRFEIPSGVIRKIWETDFLSGFVGGWEISTHHLDVKAETLDEMIKRQRKRAGKLLREIAIKFIPHLSEGEKLGTLVRVKLSGNKLSNKKELHVTDGWTIPSGKPSKPGNILRAGVSLKSGRGLISVCTRINLKVGLKITKFKYNDSELLETFFHEIACHAGRINQGVPDTHGNTRVDTSAADIHSMFPKYSTVDKLFKAINELPGLKKTGTDKRRGTLGFKNSPVIDAGTLARIESRPPTVLGYGIN
jgi:hypothetical protein